MSRWNLTSIAINPVRKNTKLNQFFKRLFPFQAYKGGGVSSGPPPKRGPNPQVPPK